MARIIRVIETYEVRGLGTEASPFRRIRQYWSLKGALLWEEPDEYAKKPADAVFIGDTDE